MDKGNQYRANRIELIPKCCGTRRHACSDGVNLEKAVHREGRQGHEGKQSTSLVIKITHLVIASGFALALISLASFASLAVQMLDLGLMQPLTAQEIAQWCRERLAPQKVPRYVVFVDELPHTPTHKVAKMALRGDAALRQRAVDLQAVKQRTGHE